MTEIEIKKELYRLIDTQKGDQLMELYDVVKTTLGIHKSQQAHDGKQKIHSSKDN